jgi:hypothetical protein
VLPAFNYVAKSKLWYLVISVTRDNPVEVDRTSSHSDLYRTKGAFIAGLNGVMVHLAIRACAANVHPLSGLGEAGSSDSNRENYS